MNVSNVMCDNILYSKSLRGSQSSHVCLGKKQSAPDPLERKGQKCREGFI